MLRDLKFIGNNIRTFHWSRNWTPTQPASKIGIQKGPLGGIKRCRKLPSATVIYNLSQALDIPTNALFTPDHQPQRGSQTFCRHTSHA